MPRYAVEPYIGQCQVEDCDRKAMSSTSRVCRRHYMARWRAEHPDYNREYLAGWKAANPDRVAEYRRRERGKA